ncbi:MAG: LytTR family DNA-binding domain-containing protein [Steroidobacteraceae bacterium]
MTSLPRALIVDDEAPARARLAALLTELQQVEVVGEAADAAQALARCEELHPDVVYLDVRMPGMSGLELARHLMGLDAPPAVIFTTAYDEHALEAFETHALGYLLKPVRKEKLAAATGRAVRLGARQLEALAPAAPRTHLALRQRDGMRLLRVEEVICLVADQKYVTVRHPGGDDLIEDSLRQLETELGAGFIRIHRNTLVNRACVAALERNAEGQYLLRLRGIAEPLAVSRRLAAEVKEALERH